MENGAFSPKKQMLNFHDIFKYMIFQRRQNVSLWSKGLNPFPTSHNFCRLLSLSAYVLRQPILQTIWTIEQSGQNL